MAFILLNRRSPYIPTNLIRIEGIMPEQKTYKNKSCGSASASTEKNSTSTTDEIKSIISNVMYFYNNPTVTTDDECEICLFEFFQRIQETGEIPTFEKLCLALGISRTMFNSWERGSCGTRRASLIKKARDICGAFDAELVSSGKIPQITYIFRSKNFFGMRDQQEIVISPDNSLLENNTNPEDLRKKYLDSINSDIIVVDDSDAFEPNDPNKNDEE